MKIKTSELIGPALDWAVAKCLYADEPWRAIEIGCGQVRVQNNETVGITHRFCPQADWAQGGPIIERVRSIGRFIMESDGENMSVQVWPSEHTFYVGYGPTPLIAAMRCYVTSKLGNEVDIPEELL